MKWYERRLKAAFGDIKNINVESMDNFEKTAFGSYTKKTNGYDMRRSFQFIRNEKDVDD